MNKKVIIIILILVIAILLAGGCVFLLTRNKKTEGPGGTSGSERQKIVPSFGQGINVGEALSVGEGIINPLENAPSVNPLEDVKNPFKDSYKNPFSQ